MAKRRNGEVCSSCVFFNVGNDSGCSNKLVNSITETKTLYFTPFEARRFGCTQWEEKPSPIIREFLVIVDGKILPQFTTNLNGLDRLYSRFLPIICEKHKEKKISIIERTTKDSTIWSNF